MNILFLTIATINDISSRGIYQDLANKFREYGHQVFLTCPLERRYQQRTNVSVKNGISVLGVKTLNFQKTNIFEKGLGSILIERQYFKAINQYYGHIKFDLILYTTPPITFTKVIEYFKKRDGALTYLLLKDIFPQNAIDLQMLIKGGLLHRFFMKKEKAMYAVSDFIGCMSPANVQFIKKHHKELNPNHIEVNPNSVTPITSWLSKVEKENIRAKYSLPVDATIFIYGGNLGKPQGLDFLFDILESNKLNNNVFFLIVGSGREYGRFKKWFEINQPSNALLINSLPKEEYDKVLQACDVGLIFLDRRFTIPNFPSRLLSYMECKMPVIAATDINTDIGKIMEANNFGYWCENGDLINFNTHVSNFALDRSKLKMMGISAHNYMMDNYLTDHSVQKIVNHISHV